MSRPAWPLAVRPLAAESCSHSVRAHLANNLKKDAHTCVGHCQAARGSILNLISSSCFYCSCKKKSGTHTKTHSFLILSKMDTNTIFMGILNDEFER